MKDILYINTSDCVGGAAKVAWKLGHNLKNKYSASYITYEKNSEERNVFKIPKDSVSQFISSGFGNKLFNYYRYGKGFILSNDIDFGFGWKQLKNNSQYIGADIIHLNNLHGNYFKLSTLSNINKPIVWTLHDEWTIMPHGAWSDYFDNKNKFYKRKNLSSYPPMLFNNEKYLMKKKKEIYQKINPILVVPSVWLKKRVEKSILGNKDIKLIPNGIDTDIYKRHDKKVLRNKLRLPQNKKIILFLASGGKNNPQKGWEHTKRIIDDLKSEDYLFLCIGGNEDRSFMEKNILYIPYIKDEHKLCEYYSAADIFLFTSNHENFPLTTLEAMSSGLPTISFDVGGVSEQIINGKTGFVTKMRDYIDMDRKIINLLSNIEILENMSMEAGNHVKNNFSLTKMSDSYTKLYETLIERNN